jgi:integrase
MKPTRTIQKLAKFKGSGSTSVARKFHFTRERIDALPAPKNGQRAYFYDAKVRGLAIAVTGLGKKTFILYRKVAGRPERVTIGPYLDLAIEQARNRAEEMNADIALGENPAKVRRTVRDEMTLQELFNTFLELYSKKYKKTWSDDQGIFNLHLASWKLRKISSIRKMDVVALHSHIGRTRGQYAANRVVELLCSMFNRAREEWEWTGTNPAAGIKAYPEKKRDRFLQAYELPIFFKALAQEPNANIRDYILISLLTGARRRNIQALRWAEIDFDRAEWKIPETKNGEPMTVTLSAPALNILETRRDSSIGEWVFPGIGTTGHLVEPKSAWKRILKRAATIQMDEWLKANPKSTATDFAKLNPNAGFKDLRLHDLRRTLGSWQAATGASLPIIGKSLGHKSLGATQIYARLNLDPVRDSVNRATDAMFLAGGVAGLLKEGSQ